jgi:hypothetical protein
MLHSALIRRAEPFLVNAGDPLHCLKVCGRPDNVAHHLFGFPRLRQEAHVLRRFLLCRFGKSCRHDDLNPRPEFRVNFAKSKPFNSPGILTSVTRTLIPVPAFLSVCSTWEALSASNASNSDSLSISVKTFRTVGSSSTIRTGDFMSTSAAIRGRTAKSPKGSVQPLAMVRSGFSR